MKTNFIKISSSLLLMSIFLYSCNNNKKTDPATNVEVKKDSTDHGMPKFLNSLNLPELELPAVGHFCSANSFDTLDFDVKESDEYLFDFAIFSKEDKKNRLHITIASEFRVYNEGDLDGDGTNEIGILPGYNSSACRTYLVYSFANHNWKLLYSVSSHLADRERGVDYVKREGDSIRILSADDGCCACFGLDTSYLKR